MPCCAGSTQQHWPFPEHRIPLGYAYLFTHPGNPTIFWDHYFNSHAREVIDQLIALRKRCGITAASKLEILAADEDFYVARIDNKCAIIALLLPLPERDNLKKVVALGC